MTKDLPAGAGSSLFVGNLGGGVTLPSGFVGSAVAGSDQPVVATLVQLPQNNPSVQNRPLSNGFSSATARVLLATLLKNRFNTTSKFSVQNASNANVDITVKVFNADNPAAPSVDLTGANIPAGSAKYFDMGQLGQFPDGFNGSATVDAVASGTTTPASIVGSVMELGTGDGDAKAFEGVSAGSKIVYMATALCQAFGGQITAYAVQNTGTAVANVLVTYSSGVTASAAINPGAKASFDACANGNAAGFSGAATITSNEDIVVIGKARGGGLGTAFLGVAAGSPKLAMPYVRYTSDANYNTTNFQRVNLAIQNVGAAAVSGVTVKYLDKTGAVVGTHNLPAIAPGAKVGSNAVAASGDAAKLLEFGTPAADPGGGFGGSAIIEGPAGSQLVAVARVASRLTGTTDQNVAEDYNGIPVQ